MVGSGDERYAAAVEDRRQPEGELMAEGTRKEVDIRRKGDNVSGRGERVRSGRDRRRSNEEKTTRKREVHVERVENQRRAFDTSASDLGMQ